MVKSGNTIVAIFGGSFDPPHLGHQEIAKAVLRELDIDLLLILPAYQNPFKQVQFATPAQRLAWCQKVFDDKRIKVDAYEIDNEICYTYQSIEYFRSFYDVRYLVIGADNLEKITLWRNFEWLNDTITWIVVTRGDNSVDTTALRSFKMLHIDNAVSSTSIRESGDLSNVDEKIRDEVETYFENFRETSHKSSLLKI
ncbi:MAG: nicotinate (nicotinamide) nucleotide adenylyltransferase [Campylobacterales bacterium]|nr:nicotinate (nicotinamide) nucleotide adenylyltransferase [Campylobacterales bacterium]